MHHDSCPLQTTTTTPIPAHPASRTINLNRRELVQALALLHAAHAGDISEIVEVPEVEVDGWEDDKEGADDVAQEGGDEGFADVRRASGGNRRASSNPFCMSLHKMTAPRA